MAQQSKKEKLHLSEMKELEKLSPFELKDKLIQLASEQGKASTRQMLNAGRGNPNWIATTPREAFFALGRFGIEESKRVWDEPDLGGMPEKKDIAQRFRTYLQRNANEPGVPLLRASLDYGVQKLGFDADAYVHELTDSIIGDNYPVPGRMLVHCERVAHEYLMQEMCDRKPPPGRYDIFAVEGGTAAMCYIFDTLVLNHLLKPGDTIALGTPVFTPYLEMPHLGRYQFKPVHIEASEIAEAGYRIWQYPDSEIDKLANPKIKAFFVVNPSNPPSVAMRPNSMKRLIKLVKGKRPDLMLLTDDVYGTFVNGFRSLMAELPRNTIGVYSYSKYFGCTGWRLGVVAVHENNVYDEKLAKLPATTRRMLNKRYGAMTLHPDKLKFIDRMVADSRQVALNHTAGLSLPQQVQMALFSLFALLDTENRYKKLTQTIVNRRLRKLVKGLDIELWDDPLRAGYYATIDLLNWAKHAYGSDFVEFATRGVHPFDVLFALAERHGTVLLNGSGFAGPDWSVRVSLANLDDAAYEQIGDQLRALLDRALERWKASRKKAVSAKT
ncbi:MAG TPA: aspartate 4-decarboxylase [Burkholderiales bacterium]|nr:aspartate 4-decarboxylase [Burkholderiales bacterium]